MTTRHLLDPELLAFVDSVSTAPLTCDSLEELRRSGRERLAQQPEPPVAPSTHVIPGAKGGPPLTILHYRPPRHKPGSAAVLHVHGGGMVSGAARLSRFASAAQALELGLSVFSVDYRLAPENPFPAQLEDCHAALAWLIASAAALGINPERIVVSGDSAGGCLATGLALMLRDRRENLIAGLVLTYPMLDHRTGLETARTDALTGTGEFCWTRQQNVFAWSAYRGSYDLADHRRGWFSPAAATDLAGLPPAWIGVGTLDLFRDECLAFTERLRTAGTAVELKLYPGAPHAFNAHPDAAIARAYRADVKAAFAAYQPAA